MATLSLCMIVKDEEDTLPRCLDSVREAVDEIVIADTGSQDRTREIAAIYGARVFSFPWRDDFAAARNFSFSKATSDYVMWLDADDVLAPDSLNRFIALKENLTPAVRQVAARYDAAFDAAGRPTLSYVRERIFLRSAGFVWEGAVHEAIPLAPDAYYADFVVEHRKTRPTPKGRNLAIYEKLLKSGRAFSPRERYYYARELYDNGRYSESAEQLRAFLSSSDIWPPDRAGARVLLARCDTALGERGQALNTLLAELAYGPPTAELCCEIGHRFFDLNNYSAAAYWYEQALTPCQGATAGAFDYADCRGYIPLLQLCVCYDRMGDRVRAQAYNERAAELKPESEAVAYNRRYFKEREESANGG